MRLLLALLACLLPSLARAATPCPTVSDNVSLLSVNIVNSPQPIAYAFLDLETNYLFVSYINRSGAIFLGVPQSAAQFGSLDWSALSGYHQALMQERSLCPILYEYSVVPSGPIVLQFGQTAAHEGQVLLLENGGYLALEPKRVFPGTPIWTQ